MGALERISHAVQSAVTKGAVLRTDDASGAQRVEQKGLGGWSDWADVFHPYGFRSRAKAGAEAILCRLGGVGELVALVVCDRRYRVTLAEGEVAIFDDQGQKVHLKRGGIEIAAKTGAKVAIKNDADITGTCDATTGFSMGGTDGKNGVLTLTATIAGTPVTLAVVTVSGGLITGVVATPPTTWEGD